MDRSKPPANLALATAAFVAGGVAILGLWAVTGNQELAIFYFRYPGAAFLILAAVAESILCHTVHRSFDPGQPMGLCWGLLSMSAACGAVGAACRHLLAYHPELTGAAAGSAVLADFGKDMAGPVAMAIRAAALLVALRVHRKLGFGRGFRLSDWAILAAVGGYAGFEFVRLPGLAASAHGPGAQWYLGWAVYPLIAILAAESVALRRSIAPLLPGLFGRCWLFQIGGICLTAFGMAMEAAISREIIVWPWDSLTWLVWYPAAACFTAVPLYHRWAVSKLVRTGIEESGSWTRSGV
ncbi:MAG: hypothetical protein FJW39_33415 [Acidobacteria bacterium]|nr:hypothetical protein [Acidobacteriota bacterium]